MTASSESVTLFPRIPHSAVVTTLVVSLVWVTAVAFFAIGPHNKMPARTTKVLPFPSLPQRPVMQLAFAWNQADIDAVLESANKSAKNANIADVRTGNIRDSLFLVPGYTVLLIALTLLIARSSDDEAWWLFRAAVVLVIILALADLSENFGIWRVLTAAGNNANASAWARVLMVASAFVKWTFLGLIGLGLGAVTSLQQQRRRPWLTALLLVAGIWMLAMVGRHVVGLLPVTPVF